MVMAGVGWGEFRQKDLSSRRKMTCHTQGTPSIVTADLSSESKIGRWHVQVLKAKSCQLRLSYLAQLSFRMEKAMATHSSTLAWKTPWLEEPGRLQSMGSLRVGHDWVTSLSPFTFTHWRRKRQPTPVFLPRKSQGQRSLVGCRLCGRTESDTTEVT